MAANNALPVLACPPGTRVMVWENYGAQVLTDSFNTATPRPGAEVIELRATAPITHADRVRIRRLFGHPGTPRPVDMPEYITAEAHARARARAADTGPQQWRPVFVLRHPTTWPADMKTPPRAGIHDDGAPTNPDKD